MEEQKFNVINENGEKYIADVVTTFEYNEKEYIIYSIDKNGEESEVYVSRLVKDENGYDKLKDIDDPEERKIIMNVVKEIITTAK